ncbi:shikimate dehydrogenase family protein [Aurantibacillus circumpalustris]|uniref:shikimate dehydrogenase family protein n=1 Tax=Aurantibacillus circumpalustris TaxID=3036359 RepID=UPI00295AFE10|nr:shikimate dehydrogenase [Aurantibacillus circumpalustris]
MAHFGIIGKTLQHSFSKIYFEKKFKDLNLENYFYDKFEILSINHFKDVLVNNPKLKGLNVTIPYKESIMPYLDELSPEAKEIGAVNCIKIENTKLIGYNTDVYGFSQSIKPFLDTNHERALILGTGGASKAVAYALKKVGVEVYFVTSSQVKKTENTFFYSEINEMVMNAFKLVVNTSPVGTFPNVLESPSLPYQFFTPLHLAYDLVYNPEQTLFLKHAKEQGSIAVNGLSMLHLQAEKNWEIWTENPKA